MWCFCVGQWVGFKALMLLRKIDNGFVKIILSFILLLSFNVYTVVIVMLLTFCRLAFVRDFPAGSQGEHVTVNTPSPKAD
jgi:uncharacterized membrane protein